MRPRQGEARLLPDFVERRPEDRGEGDALEHQPDRAVRSRVTTGGSPRRSTSPSMSPRQATAELLGGEGERDDRDGEREARDGDHRARDGAQPHARPPPGRRRARSAGPRLRGPRPDRVGWSRTRARWRARRGGTRRTSSSCRRSSTLLSCVFIARGGRWFSSAARARRGAAAPAARARLAAAPPVVRLDPAAVALADPSVPVAA